MAHHGPMAYIETISEADATGELARWYQRAGNPDGTVDNVMRIHSLNVETLRTHFEMYTATMHRPSPLSRAEREMVAVAISRLNGCDYCLAHHRAGLERLLPKRPGLAEALAGGETGDLGPREAALVAFATALTVAPGRMSEADVAELRGPEATSDALDPLDCLHDLFADLAEQRDPALIFRFLSEHPHTKDQGSETLRSVIV